MAMKSSFVNASLRTGSLIAGWLMVVQAGAEILKWGLQALHYYGTEHGRHWHTPPEVLAADASLKFAAAICLLHGISKNQPNWLIPNMVYYPVHIAGLLVIGFNLIFFHQIPFTLPSVLKYFYHAATSAYFWCVVFCFHRELRHSESLRRDDRLETPNV